MSWIIYPVLQFCLWSFHRRKISHYNIITYHICIQITPPVINVWSSNSLRNRRIPRTMPYSFVSKTVYPQFNNFFDPKYYNSSITISL